MDYDKRTTELYSLLQKQPDGQDKILQVDQNLSGIFGRWDADATANLAKAIGAKVPEDDGKHDAASCIHRINEIAKEAGFGPFADIDESDPEAVKKTVGEITLSFLHAGLKRK